MKNIIRIFSLSILLATCAITTAPVQSSPINIPEAATVITDAFGYVLNAEAIYDWEDIALQENELVMYDPDDLMLNRAITFEFPFYELTYTQIWMHIDGVVFLGNDLTEPDGGTNVQPFPSTNLPNSIIAPFWEDLILDWDEGQEIGKMYFKSGGAAPNKYFIVQWNNVHRKGSESLLTFQIKLMQSGNIIFRYKEMGDIIPNIPIGIEDSDGVDGIQYIYDANQLTAGKSIYITRPADGARLKVIPSVQDGFLNKQSLRLDFEVKNTGFTEDNFAITKEISGVHSSWDVRFLKPAANAGEYEEITQTGIIPKAGSKIITVEISSTHAPIAGDFVKVKVTFQSINNSNKVVHVYAQAAVPASFAKVVINESTGMESGLWYRFQASDKTLNIPGMSSDNLSIARMGGSKYLIISDNRDSGGSSNIEYTIIDTAKNLMKPIRIIYDNSTGEGDRVRDLNPSAAITADGVIGVVFIREITLTDGFTFNTNVWFAAIEPDTGLIFGLPLTDNTTFGAQNTPGVDIFDTPTITAAADNSFTLVWLHKKILAGTGQEVHNLIKTNLRIHPDRSGASFDTPAALTNSEQEYKLYQDPVFTPLREEGSVLLTTVQNTSTGNYQFKLFYLKNNGTKNSEVVLEAGMQGVHPDLVQLRNGNLFFGYAHPDYKGIGYVIVTASKTMHRCELPALDGEKLDQVSVTSDAEGNGILTWADRMTHKHYYALISSEAPEEAQACILITPPMMYGRWWVNPTAHFENSTIAPLGSPNLYIPLIGQ
jgi:hypothetical protein